MVALTFVTICCSSILPYLFLLELQLGMYWTSLVGEDVKSAKGPKYRQYFFLPDSFLPCLPICLSMCLVFDQTHFGAARNLMGPIMNSHRAKTFITWSQMSLGSMRERWMGRSADTLKKEMQTTFRTLCWFNRTQLKLALHHFDLAGYVYLHGWYISLHIVIGI